MSKKIKHEIKQSTKAPAHAIKIWEGEEEVEEEEPVFKFTILDGCHTAANRALTLNVVLTHSSKIDFHLR